MTLGSVAEIRFSNVDKKSFPRERPVRLCNYTDVYSNDYITDTAGLMQATATDAEIERYALRLGDVIITKDSETPDDIGVPTVVTAPMPGVLCGYHLALIRPDEGQLDSVFLAKALGHDRLVRYFARLANGITRYGLPTGVVENVPLWLPSLGVQRRASAVFRTLDEAIAKTDELIAKLKAIKVGLLHDLLTRGLDGNGDIRDLDRHPKRFRRSPVGTIPRAWSIGTVKDYGEILLGRQRSPKHQSGLHTTPYLRVANVFDGWIDYSDVLSMDFTAEEKQTFWLRPGDILLNEGQSLELAGRCAVFTGPPEAFCFQNTLIRFRAREPSQPWFFRALFKRCLDTGRFRAIARQTTSVAHLGADRLARMPVAVPDGPEQEAIASKLAVHDQRIASEQGYLSKLRSIKQGLMQDLFSGHVRVLQHSGGA